MDLENLLRSQAKRYNCSECGENMAECHIHVLSYHGSRALVRVMCKNCRDEHLLQIIIQGDLAEVEEAVDEGMPENLDPITADEILDLRGILQQHVGDFRSLLKVQDEKPDEKDDKPS
jgi:hypothetical protein